jgi:hypothetical protein
MLKLAMGLVCVFLAVWVLFLVGWYFASLVAFVIEFFLPRGR